MYMSPEVIRNNKRGKHGAMDIWSLGCVVLECATGRKPWSNLDNEWYVSSSRGCSYIHNLQGNYVPYWRRHATPSAA